MMTEVGVSFDGSSPMAAKAVVAVTAVAAVAATVVDWLVGFG